MTTLDPGQHKEAIKLINNALNKACKTGTFSLDESYIIKIAMSTLEKAIDTFDQLEKLQTTPTMIQNQQII
jgi:hypothetical protein